MSYEEEDTCMSYEEEDTCLSIRSDGAFSMTRASRELGTYVCVRERE